jgi:predicted dehydrogenase/threonine dehydrogenase-like Zn-dependent dehydrogenase
MQGYRNRTWSKPVKQLLQHLRTGKTELADVPCPIVGPGSVLIQTRASLISAGTERMLVKFSKANLLQKARQQPDKVKQVLDKIRTDGLVPTLETVFRKLDEPLPLGYCNAGVVLEVGQGVRDLRSGDRVASNGNHAEVVCVPSNLVAKVPDGVEDDDAALTVLGAVALQGLRLAAPVLGEQFMVFGLGVLGLLTVELLRANGCQVIAVDRNWYRLDRAAKRGAEIVRLDNGVDPIAAAMAHTRGLGVDGVLITASAKGDALIHQAAASCRKRGRIVLVGVTGLNLRRSDFYEKELTFQVSCSYGPGRYDEQYEQAGHDYPFPFVRWTEQRNFRAVLAALDSGHLNVKGLITHRTSFEDSVAAYDTVQNDPAALGVLLTYAREVDLAPVVTVTPVVCPSTNSNRPVVGVIGAGSFAKGILVPGLARTGARLAYVADLNAAAAQQAARKHRIEKAVTDYRIVLDDPNIDAVFIAVGHHLHARLIHEALQAGKHVFVEKPLATSTEELAGVSAAVGKTSDRLLMVGFNRRFSSHVVKIRQLLAGRSEPLCMNMNVNAGYIPPEHWTQDPARGGGRVIGEGCHFIDLLAHLAASPVTSVAAAMVGEGMAVREDKMSILLEFADGSIGTVNYFANGSRSYPKEILEVHSEGRTLRMENFRFTLGYGFSGFRRFKTWRQDKGHEAEFAQFVDRLQHGGEPLIPFSDLFNVTQATLAAVQAARTGERIRLGLR